MNNSGIEKEYELIAPLCGQFGRELARQLEELLSEKNISLGFPLQYRVKTLESVLQKIERGSLGLQHVQGLNDLIGLRIILLFRRDVESVRNLIKKNFKIFSEEDTQSRLGAGEFGYASVHFQVGLQPSWKKMPTFKKAADLQAEIQVRTVAQHIWAAASHLLQYKHEVGVPPPVRRSIHRVSALLETVDLEFERVLNERKNYLENPKVRFSEETLNVDLLAKIMDETLPPKNKGPEENYASLLQELFDFSVKSENQMRELIKKHLTASLEEDKAHVTANLPNKDTLGQMLRERVENGVFFQQVGLIRRMLHQEFGEKWDDYHKKRYDEDRKKMTKS